jgi:hypothetical protein
VPVIPPAPASEVRHSINYPLVINQGDDGLAFIELNNLHAEYANIDGTAVMYFPYGSYGRIEADDVVYTLYDNNQWQLQPVGALANTDTAEHSI